MKITYPDYRNSILNLVQSVLKYYQAEVCYDTLKEVDNILNKDFRHLLLILLDGLGVNLLGKLPKTSALRKYLQKELTSVFPPTTVAATNAVLSGLPPYANGYVGWTQYFKNEDVNAVVFRNIDYYYPEHILTDNLREKYLSYESIFQKIQKSAPDIQTEELFPEFLPGGFASFDTQVDRMIEISGKKQHTFTYTYWTEPDATAHEYGVDSPETEAVLKSLNESFERLISQINDDSLVLVIADHGLVDVEAIPLMKNQELLDCLLRNPSFEPRACNFFVRENKKEEFLFLFNRAYGDKFLLLSKDELEQERLLGEGMKHPLLDDFLGDYIAIAIDKFMFSLNDNPFRAHHAGLTKDEMMVPLIVFEKD
jgi:predicted AlkP superfamily pyrophosphatase or phosphodiesterase